MKWSACNSNAGKSLCACIITGCCSKKKHRSIPVNLFIVEKNTFVKAEAKALANII